MCRLRAVLPKTCPVSPQPLGFGLRCYAISGLRRRTAAFSAVAVLTQAM